MTNSDTITGRRVGRWVAMLLGTYVLMGIVYALLLFVAAGESLFSGGGLEVIASFILPAFYANPARALTAPMIAGAALLVSATAVVLVTRAIQRAWVGSSSSTGPRTRRDSG